MTFKELNLSAPLLRAVQEAGYETPSPIQAAAIPPVLAGRDLMGCAQTGTGKTAAFALPMLDRLTANAPRRKGAIRALILTPTRELALQIGESFDAYGKYLKLRSTVIFGGVGQAPQVEALKKGVDILIACPGRLNDLIGQGFIDLSNLEIFVLDEADRMLDMGFVHDVKKVIAKLPGERQNLMFSATMPTEIEQLAAGILRKPAFVKVDPVSSTVDRIQQSLYHVEKGNKKFLLPWLIKNLQPPVVNALVFSRTKHGADKIARDLTKQGIPAAAIHGNKSQTARVTALEDFKAGKTRVLVATDIAARGIDISELSHVFNYDLPEVPETYVHRIGRTGRAKRAGVRIISAMGAGNKLDPSRLRVAHIEKTSVCPLARVMRTELRKRKIRKLKVVFSDEQPVKPDDDPALSCRNHCICPPGTVRKCTARRDIPGSTAFVPPAMGIMIASEIVRDLIAASSRQA